MKPSNPMRSRPVRGALHYMVVTAVLGALINYPLSVRGSWGSPSGTFVARSGQVTLVGSGAINTASVFKNLTIAVPFTHITLYSTPMVSFMTPFMAAFLGLGLNEGAYMAEIVRAGILSVE